MTRSNVLVPSEWKLNIIEGFNLKHWFFEVANLSVERVDSRVKNLILLSFTKFTKLNDRPCSEKTSPRWRCDKIIRFTLPSEFNPITTSVFRNTCIWKHKNIRKRLASWKLYNTTKTCLIWGYLLREKAFRLFKKSHFQGSL